MVCLNKQVDGEMAYTLTGAIVSDVSYEKLLLKWRGTYNLRIILSKEVAGRRDKVTYILVAEQRGRVSSVCFGEEKIRRTDWWRNCGAGRSAAWILARRGHDAHPGGGTASQEGQQR
jgi:hypothetical protein